MKVASIIEKKINANADMHFFRQIKVASFIPDRITKESILLFKIPIVQYRKHNVLLVYQWFHKIPWYNMVGNTCLKVPQIN